MAALSQEETALASASSPGKESPVAPLSQEETAHAQALSPWLQLMLAEIARKRDDLASARAEAARRELEAAPQEGGERDGRDYVSAQSAVRGPPSPR